MSRGRKPRPKHRRKGRAGPPDPHLPQERLEPMIARLNELIAYYEQSWPDGVDPKSFLANHVEPVVRWYNSGERGEKMYYALKRLLRKMEVGRGS